jgi:hypothetical protein
MITLAEISLNTHSFLPYGGLLRVSSILKDALGKKYKQSFLY